MSEGFPGTVYLLRTQSVGGGAFGRFILPDGTWLHSLEDKPIPVGRYFLTPDDTGRYRNWVIELARGSRCAVPAVLDCFDEIEKPAVKDVEIHVGNTLADTEGCPVLGMTANAHGVWDSSKAIALARKVLRRDESDPPAWGLTVTEAFRCAP